jgi:hypothetical protein
LVADLKDGVGYAGSSEGLRKRLMEEIHGTTKYNALPSNLPEDEIELAVANKKLNFCGAYEIHKNAVHPWGGWTPRLVCIILLTAVGTRAEQNDAEKRIARLPFFPLIAGQKYTYFKEGPPAKHATNGHDVARNWLWTAVEGEVVTKTVLLHLTNDSMKCFPGKSGIK